MRSGRSRAGPVSGVAAGAGAGTAAGETSLVAIGYSTLMRTPSPSGSSTSMIGPTSPALTACADAVGLVAGKAGHEADGGVDEADRDAQVHVLPAVLLDLDAQLTAADRAEADLRPLERPVDPSLRAVEVPIQPRPRGARALGASRRVAPPPARRASAPR